MLILSQRQSCYLVHGKNTSLAYSSNVLTLVGRQWTTAGPSNILAWNVIGASTNDPPKQLNNSAFLLGNRNFPCSEIEGGQG